MPEHTPEFYQPQLPFDVVPFGLCMCGCGQPAPIATANDKRRGHVKGQPIRFIHGHHARLMPHPKGPSDQYRWENVPKDIDPDNLPPILPIPNWQIRDLTGYTYDRLTVLGYVGRSRHDKTLWLCRCECGRYRVLDRGSLLGGHTHSCGCLNDEVRGKGSITHGMAGTPEWHCWISMKERCTKPNSTGYEHWGGRGIKVCAGWFNSFENFFADMGKKPGKGHDFSIDRIDVNGHYSCGHCEQCRDEGWTANCRWATLEEQYNNTRRSHYLEFQGEKLTIKQWAKKLHMHHDALYYRIRAGWSVERAITTPAKRYD